MVFVGGLDAYREGEESGVKLDGFQGGDRTRVELPATRTRMLQALAATGMPVVFINCSNSAIEMPWEAEHVSAIVQA